MCLYQYKRDNGRFYVNIFCTLFQISETMYAKIIALRDGHGSFASNV